MLGDYLMFDSNAIFLVFCEQQKKAERLVKKLTDEVAL